MLSPPLMLLALIGAHFLLDHPWQGEFLSLGKNRYRPDPRIPWYHAMLAHTVMHGVAVALITGVWWLFFLETFIHWSTDDAKCSGDISFNVDQAVHILCKIIWWLIALIIIYR